MDRYLIAGLGNPGREYEATRHNMGFQTIDLLAKQLNLIFNLFENSFNFLQICF